MTRPLTIALAALLCAAPARAQRGVNATATGRFVSLRERFVSPVSQDEVHGVVLGAEGRLAAEFLSLRLGYAQGTVEDDPGPSRNLYVEGFALLGIEPVRGLELALGPTIRSRVVDGVRQRLVVWRLRGRYEGTILKPMIQGYVEATAGRPDWTAQDFATWWGGAVGLTVRPGNGHFGMGASYAIDEARNRGAGRRETTEALTITLSAYLRGLRP